MPSPPARLNPARGLSLLELVISMALGLLLSLVMVTVYLDGRLGDAANGELVRMQDNGRVSLNLLRRELALAGFLAGTAAPGGLKAAPVARDCTVGNWALDTGSPIDLIDDFQQELETATGARWECLDAADVVPGTDLFSIKRSAGEPTLSDGVFRSGVRAAEDTQWYLRLGAQEVDRSWVYIESDANFPAGDRGPGSGVAFWEFYARIFYVRGYSLEDGDGIPSLCMERLAGNRMATDCLVEGVEDMQIEFGIDNDSDGAPNSFLDAPSAAQLQQAVSARVYLLLRSVNPVRGHRDTRSYRLGDKRIPARNDEYYRRVASTTVWLRNLGLPADWSGV